MRFWPVFLSLIACNRLKEPTEDMEEALATTNNLIAVNLVSLETASHVTDSGRRDGTCPAVTTTGETGDVTLTIDYGEGCDPTSGLIPYEMSGVASVSMQGNSVTLGFDSLAMAGGAVTGTVTGEWNISLSGVTISLESDVTISWQDYPVTVVEDFTAAIGTTKATLDGSGSVVDPNGDYSATVTEAEFAYAEALSSLCPLPHSGDISIDGSTIEESVSILFHKDSPETGVITAQQGKKKIDIVLCDYIEYL